MKNLLLIIISVLLFSCKTREKAVQKSENQSEKKSEATYKIEDKTFEIIFDKSKIATILIIFFINKRKKNELQYR